MSDDGKFSLLVAIRYFGWGGLGKLRLILDNLPNARVALYGSTRINALTKEVLGSRHIFEQTTDRADVALVINDYRAANAIADLKIPVVYVDSLPYLRTTDAEIPAHGKVAYYCVQKYPIGLLPLAKPLQTAADIKWIDSITPSPRSRRGGRGVVVSLGGLHTYDISGLDGGLASRSAAAYLTLVLFPLVNILQAAGRKLFAVSGNLDADTCRRLRALLPECEKIGPQSPYGFERILDDADLLITSPGSTTILQAMAGNLPTLLLPPQNTSQILNARLYSKPGADTMPWPADMLDLEKLEQARSGGLVPASAYVYQSIVDAAASREMSDAIGAVIHEAIRSAPADGVLNPDILRLGFAGAGQVAKLIKEAMVASRQTPERKAILRE